MNRDQFYESEIQRMSNSLDLDEATEELAKTMFRSAQHLDLTRGWRAEEVIAACVYIAVRELVIPVSMDDVANVTSAAKYEIARTFRFLVKQMELEMKPEEPEKFVDEYIDRLNDKYDSKLGKDVVQCAKNIISIEIGQGELPGYAPKSIAAAAVYVACEVENKRVTQAEVADVTGVVPSTIRRISETHRDVCNRFEWL